MQNDTRNIYKRARRAAGYTQEAAAEMLNVSVESLRAYETDRRSWLKINLWLYGACVTLKTMNKAGSRANGMPLVLVDGGKYKDMIAARMRRPNGTGSWMVHKDCDLEYAEQVTAEHKITERKNGKAVYRWVLKHSHADNHYLDCEAYAAAAADVMEVRSLFLQNPGQLGQQMEKPAQPVRQTEAAPKENWIGTHEDWI